MNISARRKSICTVSVHSGCVTKPWAADDNAHSITKKAHQAFIPCQEQCYPNPLFSYSIEPSSNGLLADNKVVKVSTLLNLLLDLADDRAKVLDVLFDLHR